MEWVHPSKFMRPILTVLRTFFFDDDDDDDDDDGDECF